MYSVAITDPLGRSPHFYELLFRSAKSEKMIILLLLFLKTGELCTVRAALGFGDIPSGVEFYGKCTETGTMKLPSELEKYQSIQFEKGTKIFKKIFYDL